MLYILSPIDIVPGSCISHRPLPYCIEVLEQLVIVLTVTNIFGTNKHRSIAVVLAKHNFLLLYYTTIGSSIDEFRVWDVALTASQVIRNYQDGPNAAISSSTTAPTAEPSLAPSLVPLMQVFPFYLTHFLAVHCFSLYLSKYASIST
jgi:hypothetical protein